MTAFFLAWYAVGFFGAWLASLAMLHLDGRFGFRKPFSRGRLFATAFWAIFGPITLIPASIWWMCELSDTTSGWWSRPVFPRKDNRQ